MPIATPRRSNSFAKRKPPHRVIIARDGELRTFTIRPWLAGTVVVGAALFGTLYLAATGYLFFRDDILAASIAEQTHMRQAYEDRIAALRSDIDRLTSRQLLNQQQIEADVQRLSGRQAALDARQDVIAGLSQAARRVGIAPDAAAAPEAATAEKAAAAEAPAKAGISSPLTDATIRSGAPGTGDDPAKRVSALESSLEFARPRPGRLCRQRRRARQAARREDRRRPQPPRPEGAAQPHCVR